MYVQRLAWQTRDVAGQYDPISAQPPKHGVHTLTFTPVSAVSPHTVGGVATQTSAVSPHTVSPHTIGGVTTHRRRWRYTPSAVSPHTVGGVTIL